MKKIGMDPVNTVLDEIMIPDIVVDEIKNHIQNTINTITYIIHSIDNEKYKISNILRHCIHSFPEILLCEEIAGIVKPISSQSYDSIRYTASFIIEIVMEYLRSTPKSEQERKIRSVIIRNMSSLGEYFRKINKMRPRHAPFTFFVELMKDINRLLNFIKTNIKRILESVVKSTFGSTVLVIGKDMCRNISNDNDMRIYCYALVHSDEKLKTVFLVTKDRHFKDNEEKWKTLILNKLHLISPCVKIVRI